MGTMSDEIAKVLEKDKATGSLRPGRNWIPRNAMHMRYGWFPVTVDKVEGDKVTVHFTGIEGVKPIEGNLKWLLEHYKPADEVTA